MENKQQPKRDFKKGISTEDSRRRREESTIKLRKEKKEEGLAKRRNIQLVSEVEEENINIETNQSSMNNDLNFSHPAADPLSLSRYLQGLLSNDVPMQIQCLKAFRRLLSKEKNPPVNECVDLGVIPIFIQFLSRSDNMELQFEAAWALTNVASTDKTRYVVECNAVPPLIALLTSANADIREQSAWCLGNIAGEGSDLRDLLLSHNALPALLANIAQPASLSLLRNCTWSLSNFCRGKPQPKLNVIAPALPALCQLIHQKVDQDVVVDAAWALSYVSDGSDERIQSVLELGILPSLIHMIASGNNALIVPALRTIGNIVSGNDKQTQAVVDSGALIALNTLLTHPKKNVRKEACWVMSNIAAGTPPQMNQLFLTPDLIQRVLDQLSTSSEWDVRKEAAWVISNICSSATGSQLIQLVEFGVIRPLCDLLDVGDSKIILITLDSMEAILKQGEQNQNGVSYTTLIDEAGGVDMLEKLQEHENHKVYERSIQIIERYFGVEEEAESENIVPQSNGNQFNFGFNNVDNNKINSFLPSAPTNTKFQQPPQPISNQQFAFQF